MLRRCFFFRNRFYNIFRPNLFFPDPGKGLPNHSALLNAPYHCLIYSIFQRGLFYFPFYKVKPDHKKKNHCFFQRNFCKESRFYLIFPVLHTVRPDVPMNSRCLFQYPADNTFRQGHIYSAGHRHRREHGKREGLPFQ